MVSLSAGVWRSLTPLLRLEQAVHEHRVIPDQVGDQQPLPAAPIPPPIPLLSTDWESPQPPRPHTERTRKRLCGGTEAGMGPHVRRSHLTGPRSKGW